MKKILLALSIIITSCSSSKKTAYLECSETLSGTVMVMPVIGVNESISQSIYPDLEKQIKRAGLDSKFYLSSEYDLATENINMDNEDFLKRLSQIGYKYILIVDLVNTKKPSAAYNYYTDFEVNNRESNLFDYRVAMDDKMSRNIKVVYTLVSTISEASVFQIAYTFEQSPVAVGTQDSEGEMRVNPGSIEGLIRGSLPRGLKKSLSDCN